MFQLSHQQLHLFSVPRESGNIPQLILSQISDVANGGPEVTIPLSLLLSLTRKCGADVSMEVLKGPSGQPIR